MVNYFIFDLLLLRAGRLMALTILRKGRFPRYNVAFWQSNVSQSAPLSVQPLNMARLSIAFDKRYTFRALKKCSLWVKYLNWLYCTRVPESSNSTPGSSLTSLINPITPTSSFKTPQQAEVQLANAPMIDAENRHQPYRHVDETIGKLDIREACVI